MAVASSIVEAAAGLLPPDQREAVLGDLAEEGASPLPSLCAIFGLLARQHTEHWRDWRPWIAGAMALPGSRLLLGASFGLSMSSRPLLREGLTHIGLPLLCEALLLLAWSWTSGYTIGFLSRRTLWVSAALCVTPCLCCVLRFREPSLSRFCVLLFLIPGLVGAVNGLRPVRLHFATTLALAVTVTGLMLAWRGMWFSNWPLVFPSWFLVATAHTPARQAEELSS